MAESTIKNSFGTGDEETAGFDFQSLIAVFLMNIHWYILCIGIALGVAYYLIRTAIPLYSAGARVEIKDEKSNYETRSLMDLGVHSVSDGRQNDIAPMRTTNISKQVIRNLKLYTTYFVSGNMRDTELYRNQPVTVDLEKDKLFDLPGNIVLTLSEDQNGIKITGNANGEPINKRLKFLPAVFNTKVGKISVYRNPEKPGTIEQPMTVTITNPNNLAPMYASGVSINPASDSETDMVLGLSGTNADRCKDYLRELVSVYNDEWNRDKNMVAQKTEEFINKRIELISKELGDAESKVEDFKVSEGTLNIGDEGVAAYEKKIEYQERVTELNMQLGMLSALSEYINKKENHMQLIPNNIGIQDGTITTLVNEYNKDLKERARLMRNSSETSPVVVQKTLDLEQCMNNIKAAITSARYGINLNKKDLTKRINEENNKVIATPSKQRILANFSRQQDVKAGLYIMLLQKREENSITMAATTDKAKLVDDPYFAGQIYPKEQMIWVSATAIGFTIPSTILFILAMFRYKIEGRSDIEKLTTIPILGDVPIDKNLKQGERAIVVKPNTNNLMAETFRGIRTNLDFVMEEGKQKVLLVTSTSSGEGKTFIASNIAMSESLLGRKVLLIGLDIRKPRIISLFGLHDKRRGITAYLSGDINDYDTLMAQIMPSGISDHLDLLPSGTIPPNPSELLAKKNIGAAVAYLRNIYDMIIIDTAPVGQVSDTLQLGYLADASIYVVRADYTPKATFSMINSLRDSKKLPSMNLVLNGIDLTNKKYGYYYGYGSSGKGYGYGYGRYGYGRYGYGKSGYGYGYGLYEDGYGYGESADTNEEKDKNN